MPSPSPERLIRIVQEHWMKYVFPVVVYVLLMGISMLLFFFAGLSIHHYMWLSHATFFIALLLMLASHHWFFTLLLSEHLGDIIITNRRVIHMETRLLFEEHMHEISFARIKFVQAKKQGVLQNLLRYGSLVFERGMTIPLVPHPNSVARDIERAMGMQ